MTRAEAIAAVGLTPDAPSIWPTCGCSDDYSEPGAGGTGHADDCQGPRHPALVGLGPREHYEPSRLHGPASDDFNDDGEWVLDAPCRCPCHV
jgi:hypothetical protein